MEKEFFYKQLVKSFGATAAQNFYRVLQEGDTGKGLIAMANRHRLRIVRQSSRSCCDYSNNTLRIQYNAKKLNAHKLIYEIIYELNNYKNRGGFEKSHQATVKLLQDLPLNKLHNTALMARYAKEYAYKQFYIEMLTFKDTGRVYKDYRDRHPYVSLSERALLSIGNYEDLCAGKTSLVEWTKTRMKKKWSGGELIAGNPATSHEQYYRDGFYRYRELIINIKIRAQSESSSFRSISSHKTNQLSKKPKRQKCIIQ